MLALNHATLASAIAFGGSIYFDKPFFLPLILFVIFAGVFPDIDHPNSELGKWFRPVGKMLPHRGITHSFLGTAIFGGSLYFLLGNYGTYFNYFLIFGAIFGVYLAQKIFKHKLNHLDNNSKLIGRHHISFLLQIATVILYGFLACLWFLAWNDALKTQALYLLIVGYLAHIVGDFVTIEGVPLFFPIKTKFGLKLFRTGSEVEAFVGFLLFILNAYLIYIFCQKFGVLEMSYWKTVLK